MIKIPGTDEGIPAIEEALYEGLNINVTLLFAVAAYERVTEAFIRGAGAPPRGGQARSTATRSPRSSSRASTPRSTSASRRSAAASSPGRAGLANARAAYRALQGDLRRRALRRAARRRARRSSGRCGRRPASRTRQYPDTMYVDGLVGPRHRQHDADADAARRRRARARSTGATAAERPEPDLRRAARGRASTSTTSPPSCCATASTRSSSRWTKLLDGIERQARGDRHRRARRRSRRDPRRTSSRAIAERVQRGDGEDVARRIWKKDGTLWGPAGHGRGRQPARLADDRRQDARGRRRPRGVRARRCATTGSPTSCCSAWAARRLAPEVFRLQLRRPGRLPALHVLDSTDAGRDPRVRGGDRPRQDAVPRLDEVGRDDRDAVAVHALPRRCGPTGRHFVAITDPGSRARGARRASTASGARSSTTPTSAGATARCRTSGSCPRR